MSRPSNEELLARLAQAKDELQSLDEAIRSGDIDARVLREFREAVDHIRMVGWTVQQWLELQTQKRDAYTVMPLLTTERIRRATRLSEDLIEDLEAADVTVNTAGLDKLNASVERLHGQLSPLFGSAPAKPPKKREEL